MKANPTIAERVSRTRETLIMLIFSVFAAGCIACRWRDHRKAD